ncbi:MAG TPA: zinc dependent phospholipase C family protein [Candidatus Fimenecus excrementigallinarum]|uniref:Zinc dependent phospholipase C family protein n=1 Tax=Candidatus Fimenecus excrementigallinarum TaxID=2840816 RepID=A0A9D1IF95_9FIRM|nr:zinc dependent phospholipase C family protein [Candidatus Fimenecus excrementigallinarum]
MFKKGISVFLSLTVLLLCVCSVPVFASEPEFDINDYTIEDLYTMTTAEKKELIANFIETYNPYGMRDLLEQETQTSTDSKSEEPQIELYWKSDSELFNGGQQIATHQIITLEAFLKFVTDYGFYQIDGSAALAIALNLASVSALPDREENDNHLFYGHFYDPNTGTNYLGDTSPTAKTRIKLHYDHAVEANSSNEFEKVAKSMEDLGKALHYIQDVCEPHHAANKTAVNSSHGIFEAYVDNNLELLMPILPSLPNTDIYSAQTDDVEDLLHTAAIRGKYFIDYTTILQRSNWDYAGTQTLYCAALSSMQLIYKFFYEINASFL